MLNNVGKDMKQKSRFKWTEIRKKQILRKVVKKKGGGALRPISRNLGLLMNN